MKLKNGLKNVNMIGFMDGKAVNTAEWIQFGGMLMATLGVTIAAIGKVAEHSYTALFQNPIYTSGNNPNMAELYRLMHEKTSDK